MNDLELAKLNVKRAELMAEIKEIDEQLIAEALERKESIPGTGFRVTYYKPSRKYDYALAAASHPNVNRELIEKHTKYSESVSWAKVCEEAEIPLDEVPYEEVPERAAVR